MAQNLCFSNRSFASGLIVLIGLLVPQLLFGAELSVTPMFQEVVINDEREAQAEVTLTNTTQAITPFRLSVYDFGNLDESGGVAFLGAKGDLRSNYALAEWMKIDRDTVSLAPGESATIQVTIRNDDTLAPGGHYGAVVFQSAKDPERGAPNTIAINHMVAALLFVKKVGGANPKLALIEQQETSGPFRLPEMTLRFRNEGNVHVVPRGMLELRDPAGRLVAKGIINEATSLVLPETERLFPVKLFPVKRAWLPGWYTLDTSYRFDGEEQFTVSTKRYFSFPPLTLGLGLFLGGVYVAWRSWRRRKLRVQTKTGV